jgi:hypothetical protein
MGGESQKASLTQVTGYSIYAHCIGTPAYLEPISQSLQKTYRGEVRIGAFHNQKHVEIAALNKGAIDFSHALVLPTQLQSAECTSARNGNYTGSFPILCR